LGLLIQAAGREYLFTVHGFPDLVAGFLCEFSELLDK
jgi:hypothetical protein